MPKLPLAKKSLGQNWLVNPGVVERIVREVAPKPGQNILEVGPGTGLLTEQLAPSGAHILAVEKDRQLADKLRERFLTSTNVEIITDDILKFSPSEHSLQSRTYALVGNIPYYLTSHLIRIALESWQPTFMVLMVQYEVAKRILARPPAMNLLALGVQLFAQPALVMRVSRGSFRPTPSVDSAVIRLDLRDIAPKEDCLLALKLARKAFGQKRKQLSALFSKELLENAGIPPTARPQELSPGDWLRLSTLSTPSSPHA